MKTAGGSRGGAQRAPIRLTERTLRHGLTHLADKDRDLARILDESGPPPIWSRTPGFATLVWIILGQQVSLASAQAAFDRLLTAVTPLTPDRFLGLDDAALKTIGFSRQKTGYCRELARAVREATLNLARLDTMPDAEAQAALTQIKGIGPWSAQIYLLMAHLRPDIWPGGDLALARAVHRVKGLPAHPDPAELEGIASAWRPWRSVAARLLWHEYIERSVGPSGPTLAPLRSAANSSAAAPGR